MRLLAYAKLNLTLDILGRREDGYHDLCSIMQSISLHDVVEVELEPGGGGVIVECETPGVPEGPANVAHRAAVAAMATAGVDSGVRVHLEKHIPAGSGLGGGSSDAAAVILGLRHLLPDRITDLAALDIAEEVGADVPFFLTGGTALVSGIGERVAPVARLAAPHFALVKPDFAVGTKWAYDLYDRRGERQMPSSDRMVAALGNGALDEVAAALGNHFWPVVSSARPELDALHRQLLGAGALGASMTGSGSCLFGIYPTESEAAEAARALSGRGRFTAAAEAVDCGVAVVEAAGPEPVRVGVEGEGE